MRHVGAFDTMILMPIIESAHDPEFQEWWHTDRTEQVTEMLPHLKSNVSHQSLDGWTRDSLIRRQQQDGSTRSSVQSITGDTFLPSYITDSWSHATVMEPSDTTGAYVLQDPDFCMWYNAPSYILERVVFQVYTVYTVEMTSPPEVYWLCTIEVRHYPAYKHFVLMIIISYFKKLYAQDYTELRMKLVLSFKKIGAEYCQ